jgi:hypothetical protein
VRRPRPAALGALARRRVATLRRRAGEETGARSASGRGRRSGRTPFVLTTPLARLALARAFPANDSRVGSATLGLSGTLILRDLVLHDTGARAGEPLLTAREVGAAFGWAELLARRIRRVHAEGVTVYARTGEASALSVLGLVPAPSGEPAGDGAPAVRIDAIDVRGRSRLESAGGLAPGGVEWPLKFRMTASSGRPEPARRFRVALGDTRRLPVSGIEPPKPVPPSAAAFGLRAEAEIRPAAGGTRVVLHRLAAAGAAFTADAGVLRRLVPALPPELEGSIEAGVGSLWASGELAGEEPANGPRLTGSLALAGLRVRVPAERGRIEADLGALEVAGRTGAVAGAAPGFSGTFRLHDLGVRAPVAGGHALVLDRLTASGSVESPLGRWAPAAVTVRDGVARWASLTYGDTVAHDLDASWHAAGGMLAADRLTVRVFGGRVSGSPVWDLARHAMPPSELRVESIDMHRALANISPERFDAEGTASGVLRLALDPRGDLSGHLDLAFDGPGVLKIGEIEEVRRMLVGSFGLELADLAVQDLQDYPFRQGRVYLESSGPDAELKIRFVRQPRGDAEARAPSKHVIDGREVWVGSLIVPTLDLTIPITGTSLAEILSMAGGVRP